MAVVVLTISSPLQGAYVARLLNRRYDLTGRVPVAPSAAKLKPTDWGSFDTLGDWVRLRGDLSAREFHFLNLGELLLHAPVHLHMYTCTCRLAHVTSMQYNASRL